MKNKGKNNEIETKKKNHQKTNKKNIQRMNGTKKLVL
jgi:hypothetical protein